jgi:hypothetical protein
LGLRYDQFMTVIRHFLPNVHMCFSCFEGAF